MMRAKESITIRASLQTAAFFLIAISLLPNPAWAVGQVFDANHACAEDSGGVSSCTANEINIASASTSFTDAEFCLEGETVFVNRIDVSYGLNTGLRYDPLLWVGTQGNDPRDSGGVCYVSSAPSDAGDANPIFVDLEGSPGDSCLDILNPDLSDKLVSYVFESEVSVECQNFDGILDSEGIPDANVRAIITWLQNTSLSCGDKEGEEFSPGAPPKCDASVISLGIPFIPLGEQATLTLLKDVNNAGGGTNVDTDWTLSATGLVNRSGVEGDPAITSEVLPMGDYVLSESGGPGGYTASSWNCSGGSLSGNTLTLAGGDVALCTITNTFITSESLTISKVIQSDNGGGSTLDDFDVSVDGGEIVWTNPASTTGDSEIISDQAGTYSLSELDTAGYSEGTWECLDGDDIMLPVSNGGAFDGADVTVGLNQHVTCTITNNDIAPQLTIINHVINDNAGTAVASDWIMDVTATNPGSNNFPGSEAPGVTINVDAGAYSIGTSGGPAGYTQSAGAGCAGALSVGESSTCTISQDDEFIPPPPPPQLTLLKDVINDDGGNQLDSDWTLTATGPVVRSGIEGSAAVTAADVLAGVYTLSESGPAGYTASGWSCAGGSLSGDQLTLVDEDVAICTITNNDIAPTLTLTKQVINDQGGTAVADDFDISVGGAIVLSGATNAYAANTPLAIDEALLAAYIFVSISGDARCPAALGGTVSLDEGEDLSCTITNNDIGPDPVIPPQLTLLKDVINDDGGNQLDSDWTLTATGPVVRSGIEGSAAVTAADVLAGVYTLSESGPAGYTASGWSCAGGSLSGDQLTLVDEDVAICTITNNDIAPTLTLTKQVINDQGGTAVADDFDISVGGAIVLSGATNAYAANTPLAIDEALLAAYIFVSISGDARCPAALGGTVSLDEGEDLSCTITNNDIGPDPVIPPQLTLLKDVINDDSGNQLDSDWTLTATGPVVRSGIEGSAAVTAADVLAGVYTLSESGPAGYTASGWSCAGGSLSGDQLTLVDEDVAICTITNNDIAPTLTLTKQVINDEGGTAVADDFDISVGGAIVLSGATNAYAANTPLAIDEALLAAYIFVSISGDARCPAALGGTVSLDEGEDLSCTITNNDIGPDPVIPPQLTLLKDVINDDSGNQLDSDWTLTATGPVVRSGIEGSAAVTAADVLAGVYTLSESGPAGYTASGWSCAGGSLSGDQLTLANEDVAICTITNDDDIVVIPGDPPTLTLTKQVINDDGGTAVANDFDISVGGSVVLSGVTHEYTANTPLEINETNIPGYSFVSITGDAGCPAVLGGMVNLGEGENLNCTITNDDILVPEPPEPPEPPGPEPGPQDISVNKVMVSGTLGCPVTSGDKVEFSITVENHGSGFANGVILNDHWSEELKPTKSPDMFECSQQKQRSARCKLGNIAAGSIQQLSFAYLVGGDTNETVCNTARVSGSPAETGDTENNESTLCFPFVSQLGTQPGILPAARIGNFYNESIQVSGGLPPYEIEVTGLPYGGLELELDSEANVIHISGCPTYVVNNTRTLSVDVQYFGDSESDACEMFSREYTLTIEPPPNCAFDKLTPVMIEQRGISTGTLSGKPFAPDESVQKIVVNDDVSSREYRYRYLVGFVYQEHNYTSDPNGQFIDHALNYDIRVVKYDDSGVLQWDKTYDTGNDDYGYAVTLSADKQRIYVGGGSEVESSSQARHDAVLLEIDADSGCSLGTHFQSAGAATTSAYYDIETNGNSLYAVGERQVNPAKEGENGGLVSVFSHGARTAKQDNCADQLIISEAAGNELTWKQNLIRAGASPTVAYAVKLPEPGCTDCKTLVGGISGADGWLDTISGNPGNESLIEFPETPAMSVQDIATQNAQIILVGSTPENNMKVQSFKRQGGASWGPTDLGNGRLRAVATDASGFVYAVGTSDGEGSAGLVFKFDASGNEINRTSLGPGSTSGTGVAFHDLAILELERGVIAAQSEADKFDMGWFQVGFGCEESCEAPQ